MAGQPRGTRHRGRHRIGTLADRRRSRTSPGTGRRRTRRGSSDRLRAAALGSGPGRRSADPHRGTADLGCGVIARRPADPNRGDPRAGPPGPGLRWGATGRGGRALPGCAGRRGTAGRWRQGRRTAGAGPAARRRRHPGGPAPRHHRPRRPPADGVGDQRRPRADRRAARRVRARRPHRASAGAVHPQRPSVLRHHRDARAAVPFRVVLRTDLAA